MNGKFETIDHTGDLCVIGGGMSGICTAIAAARQGIKVVLVHDRPVFGGNASEEIRMWICGAAGANMRETGIIEEIELENIYRNPQKNYSIWSALLHDFVSREKNIEIILNASVLDGEIKEHSTLDITIESITAWQLTTQRFHKVKATLYTDCSGDSILAPLTGAETRWGRESVDEFGESHGVTKADSKTMGMSCLIQPQQTTSPQPYFRPWFSRELNHGDIGPGRYLEIGRSNYWWLEVGGDKNSIKDTEELRDELLGIATGVWDLVKRNPETYDSTNWTLGWMGFLPGKRESRRYVGDHIISQCEVEDGGPFEDMVAYGGWSMDVHAPAGFYDPGEPTIFHPAPSPWGIPYRSLYSRNVNNLLFAGRNISATHVAMSSSRVMRTCAIIGQAVGIAAALAVRYGVSPREVYHHHLQELQQLLMINDAYLPGIARKPNKLVAQALLSSSNEGTKYQVSLSRSVYPPDVKVFSSGLVAGQRVDIQWYTTTLTANPELLRNGIDRTVGDTDNGFWCAPGDTITYTLSEPMVLNKARVVMDSNLSRYYRHHRMKHTYGLNDAPTSVAESLVRVFTVEVQQHNQWKTFTKGEENRQRLVWIDLSKAGQITGLRLVPQETWGAELVHLFAFDFQ